MSAPTTPEPQPVFPSLHALDARLADGRARRIEGWRGGAVEFLWFGIKQARYCLFTGLFFACVLLVPRTGLLAFKTSSGMQSWSYPDFAYTKVAGVPLFSGFMYAAVGSYITQAWRVLDLRTRHHPPLALAALVALLIYLNFFTHHRLGDARWYLAAVALGLYARTTVCYRPLDRERRMPLPLGFVLIGFFVWLAENLSTLRG